jgi:hypothetical protein
MRQPIESQESRLSDWEVIVIKTVQLRSNAGAPLRRAGHLTTTFTQTIYLRLDIAFPACKLLPWHSSQQGK